MRCGPAGSESTGHLEVGDHRLVLAVAGQQLLRLPPGLALLLQQPVAPLPLELRIRLQQRRGSDERDGGSGAAEQLQSKSCDRLKGSQMLPQGAERAAKGSNMNMKAPR